MVMMTVTVMGMLTDYLESEVSIVHVTKVLDIHDIHSMLLCNVK